MEIHIGKVVGQLGPTRWMQVHDFTPADEKMSSRGRLVAAISLKDETSTSEIEMVAAGREILSRLQELYYGNTEVAVVDHLKSVITSLLSEAEQNTMVLEIAAAVLKDDIVYLGSSSAGIWIQQSSQTAWIVNPDHDSGSVRVLSGRLNNQILVLGTTDFWKAIPEGMVRAAVETDGESMVDTLGGVIHSSERGKSGVGVIIKVVTGASVAADEVTQELEEEVKPALRPQPQPQAPSEVEATPNTLSRKLAISEWMRDLVAKLPGQAGPVYLQPTKRNKWQAAGMYGGIAFLVIMLGLVGAWQVRQNKINEKNSAFSQQLEEVLYRFREAKALTELNPARSRELLSGIEQQIATLNSQSGKKKDPRLAEIESGLPEVLGAATGTKTNAASEVIDLELVRSGMQGKTMRLLDGKLIVMDELGSRLAVVDPSRKKGEVVTGQEAIGKPRLLATYPGKIEVLSDKGIVECSTDGDNCQVKVTQDATWGSLRDMGMFGGNIYLLSDQTIWRHQVTDSGFSNKQDWLAEEETPDFASVSSMTIDGSIWISSGSQILKYTRGVKDNFVLEDLDKPLGNTISLYANEDLEVIYILDKDNERVVVVNKTGSYDSQYRISQAKESVDIEVDSKEGSMYLLTGSKIWQVKL